MRTLHIKFAWDNCIIGIQTPWKSVQTFAESKLFLTIYSECTSTSWELNWQLLRFSFLANKTTTPSDYCKLTKLILHIPLLTPYNAKTWCDNMNKMTTTGQKQGEQKTARGGLRELVMGRDNPRVQQIIPLSYPSKPLSLTRGKGFWRVWISIPLPLPLMPLTNTPRVFSIIPVYNTIPRE